MESSSSLAPLSESFRATARAERDQLIHLYEQTRLRHEQLYEQAEAAALEADRYLRTVQELGELLGIEDQLSIATLSEELRGERLREVASRIVFEHFRPDEHFHYKRWLELVVAEGYRIGGKNPAATFLTQVALVEGVARVGRRTGVYFVESAPAIGRAA
jgi:hypothetical protein